jgi:peptidylprolyl isomerase
VIGEKPVTDVMIHSARHIADIVTTASGLKYQDIVVGTGDIPVEGSDIDVTYSGSLVDATTDFDSGTNATFSLNALVPGFSEGVGSMRVGGIRRLIIPPELGYGESGSPPTIPPHATLTFLVELRNFWP